MKFDPKKTIFIIDGSSFLFRAYYGVRPLHTSKGVPVQAVYSFCRMIKKLIKKFEPEIVVIHSTISPSTTTTLQSKLKIPVLYSPTRGVHKRMLYDLKRYTKFFTIPSNAPKKKFAVNEFIKIMKQAGIKTKKISCFG